MSKIKFHFKGSEDGISYYKCKICKDIITEDEFGKHLETKCEKPITKQQEKRILKKILEKAIENGYKIGV